jgi:hypothetical protein
MNFIPVSVHYYGRNRVHQFSWNKMNENKWDNEWSQFTVQMISIIQALPKDLTAK